MFLLTMMFVFGSKDDIINITVFPDKTPNTGPFTLQHGHMRHLLFFSTMA